jgi:ankyrin repeat protein
MEQTSLVDIIRCQTNSIDAVPEEFICPLTKKIFNDPVISEDGITYEYQAIKRWLSDEDTSPVTGQLIGESLNSNEQMLENISSYLQQNPNQQVNQYILSKKFEDNVDAIIELVKSKNYKMLLNYTDFNLVTLFNEITGFEDFMKTEELVLIHIINNTKNLETQIINEWRLVHVICLYSIKLLGFIIKKKVNLNAKEISGMTPLHIVTRQNNLDAIKLLLSNNADPTITSPDGWNLLHYAAKTGSLEIIKFLVELFESRGEDGIFLNAPTVDGWRPIHLACHHGSYPIIEYLINKSVDLNAATSDNWTPLHVASFLSTAKIIKLILDQNVDTSKKIKKLYGKPVKCNYRDLININKGLTKGEKKELRLYKRISYKHMDQKISRSVPM